MDMENDNTGLGFVGPFGSGRLSYTHPACESTNNGVASSVARTKERRLAIMVKIMPDKSGWLEGKKEQSTTIVSSL
jgi:hypothetical protein